MTRDQFQKIYYGLITAKSEFLFQIESELISDGPALRQCKKRIALRKHAVVDAALQAFDEATNPQKGFRFSDSTAVVNG